MVRTRRTAALGALAALALSLGAVGCSGDAEPDAGAAGASAESAGDDAPLDDAEIGGGELPGSDGTTSTCAADAQAVTPAEAASSFPDNPDTVWAVEEAEATGEQVWVQAVPDSDAVGYPAFRFVYACADAGPALLGVYAAEEAGWVLLFTTDAAGADALEPSMD